MGFVSLVDEIQFMLISSRHICIRSIEPNKHPAPFFLLISICFPSRGFSRGSFDGLHPLPERPEESLSLSYLDTVYELKGLASSYYTPDISSRSSPTSENTIGGNNTFSLSNIWSTNTGNLTGRSSSVYSWGNDDVCSDLFDAL